MEEKIAKIFECDLSYANKIIASIKMNLPIQGATPKQMYDGYKIVNEPIKTKQDILKKHYPSLVAQEDEYGLSSIYEAMDEYADQFK